jgi:NAD(P)-dependent dehydrogenase (short-subunit alcohol dehydrogenase family)
MQSLKGKVAVVTGSSRGAGKGIALVLGEAGATIYVTGRSAKTSTTRPDLPNTTIEHTAEAIRKRGGNGIPIQVDHTDEKQVAALFEQVKQEQGKLDILVNNAWGGYENITDGSFEEVFWKQPFTRFDKMLNTALRATAMKTSYALPLMLPQQRGAIFNITLEMDTTFYDQALFYRTTKIALNYMTFGMAHDLHQRSNLAIAVIGVAPGWMRTEDVMKQFAEGLALSEELVKTESVEYIGRAVLALAMDKNIMQKTGHILRTRDLAREYGFVDVDGKQHE